MAAITFTATDILSRAFRTAGVLGQGEALDADQATDGLAILNGFLDRIQTQRLVLPASSRLTFPFTTGVNTYTIGPGATWDTARPMSLDDAAVEAFTAAVPWEMPLVVLSDQGYNALTQKTLREPFPREVYYNATTPSGSIFVWPTPLDAANYRIVLYLAQQLATFADLVTPVTLAPAVYSLLHYQMAVELGASWAVPEPNPVVAALAQQALRDVKRMNLQMVDLASPLALPGVGGRYTIYSDTNG